MMLAACVLLPGSASAQSVTAGTDVSIGVGDTILSLDGVTSPDAFVTVSDAGDVIATTVAGSDGVFAVTVIAQSSGLRNLALFAVDVDGRSTDTVTTSVNLQSNLPTPVTVFLPPSLSLDRPVIGPSDVLTTRGQTVPDGQITVTVDGRTTYQAVANASGRWSVAIPAANLPAGFHELFARVRTDAGRQSYATSLHLFQVLAAPLPVPADSPPNTPSTTVSQPMTQPPMLPPALLTAPRITYPQPGAVLRDPAVVVRGTGPPGRQIEIWQGTRRIGSVWPDSAGEWRLPVLLNQRSYDLRVRGCQDGRCSAFSESVSFAYQAPSPSASPLQLELLSPTIRGQAGQPVAVLFQARYGQPPYSVRIEWADGQTAQDVSSKDSFGYRHTYSQPGQYGASLQLTDENGAQQQLFFAVSIIDSQPVRVPAYVLTAAVVTSTAGFVCGFFLLAKRRRRRDQD